MSSVERKDLSVRLVRFVLALPCALLAASCVEHPVNLEPPHRIQQTNRAFQQSLEKDVDILFVVDNSQSMAQEQDNLALQFPKLIEALRAPQLGGKLPNVHIGVVSSDLGTGAYTSANNCRDDGGKLQRQPHGSCPVPRDPWISHINGQTNIDGGSTDPVEQVKQAFSCIARLGDEGCGFEQQLEAARRALTDGVNPGFVRRDALLSIVFITDEDDCSARDAELFNPMATHLGPAQYRCFLRGVTCSEQTQLPGEKHNCVPSTTPYLHQVDELARFFRGLKEEGRVLVTAIAGPPDKVAVIQGQDTQPILKPSCQHFTTETETAAPAIRLKSVVDSFEGDGQFATICTSDFGPALKKLGDKIIASLGSQCLGADPLTVGGSLACRAGEDLGGATCKEGCLERTECVVREVTHRDTPAETSVAVPRCAPEKFADPADRDCGELCPCWRLVPRAECATEHGTPYGVDILRRGAAPKNTVAHVACSTSPVKRGTPDFLALPQC